MAKWLVRFGYDGAEFAGWARQPGLRTVEGVVREGLAHTGVAPTPEAADLAVASRTDRGVSARANALTLNSVLPPAAVLRALNGIAPDIFFSALSEVAPGFSARSATRRWYRYFVPADGRSLDRWRTASALFHGEVDVRSFGRDLPPDRPALRTIDSVGVRRTGTRWLMVDVRAPSFVWGMVRKIVAALDLVDRGTLSAPRLRAALRGERRLTLPLAEPDGLVLWDVAYPLKWTHVWKGPNRTQSRHFDDVLRRARRREVIDRELLRSGVVASTVRPR